MKHIGKVFHTAEIEGRSPQAALAEHLMNFRAAPHPSTKKSPAELLFGRKFNTNLPDRREDPAGHRPDLQEAKEADVRAKDKMKKDKDKSKNVRHHDITQGD